MTTSVIHNPSHIHYCNHCGSTLFCASTCSVEPHPYANGLPMGGSLTCESCEKRLWIRPGLRDLTKAVETLIRGDEKEHKRLSGLRTSLLLDRLQRAQNDLEGASVDYRSSLEDLVDDHPQVAADRAMMVMAVVKLVREALLVLDLEGERRRLKGEIVEALSERTE